MMNKIEKKILIIEDEESILQAMIDKFSRQGFEVIKAVNGQDGLSSALTEHPDLILLDLLLPIMDGIDLLKKLRADKWGKSVPVIVLTNLSEARKVSEVVDIGIDDFLIKTDWKLEDLVKKVEKRLGV